MKAKAFISTITATRKVRQTEESMIIDGLSEGIDIFKALGSKVRMKIVRMLAETGGMDIHEIASALGVTNGAMTAHIRLLEECGIIRILTDHSGKGNHKTCILNVNQILLNVYPSEEERSQKVYETEVRIGHYSDYQVQPGCGIATKDQLIGETDSPRAFAYPEHLEAELLWFHNGYIEYRIPNLLPQDQIAVQMTVSFEITSADYGNLRENNGVVSFYLNGKQIGRWTTFQNSDESRGIYTPFWWQERECRYGFLKMLVCNQRGTYLDGKQISDVGLQKLRLDDQSEMRFRIESLPTSECKGGAALFGAGFGNYNQGIRVRVHYMPRESMNDKSFISTFMTQ